jgi:hypothetical protein
MAYGQINSGSTINGTFEAGADSFFEKVRANTIANSHGQFALGGSKHLACADGGGYLDIPETRDFVLTDAKYSGATFVAIVELRVENSGISLTPKIRNVTDASDAVVGSASTSTTGASDGDIWASQTLSFTPTVNKVYRLMGVKSADTYDAWLTGTIRRLGT